MCTERQIKRRATHRRTATEPFRRLYSQRDAKLYRRIFVHFKMQYHCFRFFYSVRVVRCLYSDLLQTL